MSNGNQWEKPIYLNAKSFDTLVRASRYYVRVGGANRPATPTPIRAASWRKRCAAAAPPPPRRATPSRRSRASRSPTEWRFAAAAAAPATGSCWGWLCAWAPPRRVAAPLPSPAAAGTAAPPRSDPRIESSASAPENQSLRKYKCEYD